MVPILPFVSATPERRRRATAMPHSTNPAAYYVVELTLDGRPAWVKDGVDWYTRELREAKHWKTTRGPNRWIAERQDNLEGTYAFAHRITPGDEARVMAAVRPVRRSPASTSAQPRMVAYIPGTDYAPGHGFRVAIVVEGENGYRPTGQWPCPPGGQMPWFWGPTLADAEKAAESYNAERGISRDDAFKIIGCSMFGRAVSR